MKDIEEVEPTLEWLGVTYRIILGPDQTGGAMSIVESVSPPDSGPPMHIHHDADETFVMLSGECVFSRAGQTLRASAGETVFVPRGAEHTFRVIGPEPSRHLVILTPGGFEGFFREMASGKYRIPEDMETVVRLGAAFNLEFTGPPLDG